MTQRSVSTELLNLTIETQIEAGVSEADIRQLIYAFTRDTSASDPGDGIVGFLSADDIPPTHRGDFLTVLLELSEEQHQPVVMLPSSFAPRFSIAPMIEACSRIRESVRAAFRPASRPAPPPWLKSRARVPF